MPTHPLRIMIALECAQQYAIRVKGGCLFRDIAILPSAKSDPQAFKRVIAFVQNKFG